MGLKPKGVARSSPASTIQWCPQCQCSAGQQRECIVCQTMTICKAVDVCKACEGTGWNSRKGRDRRSCYPCNGKGYK